MKLEMICNLISVYNLDNIIESFPNLDTEIFMLESISLDKSKNEPYEYTDNETLDNTEIILSSINYKNFTIPFDFTNNIPIKNYSTIHYDISQKSSKMSNILKIASGTVIIGGMLSFLKNFIKRLPMFRQRVGFRSIVSTQTRGLQMSSLNIERILSEYKNNLYSTLLGIHINALTQQENIALMSRIEDIQKQLSIMMRENSILRNANSNIKNTLNQLDQLEQELKIKNQILEGTVSYKSEVKKILNIERKLNDQQLKIKQRIVDDTIKQKKDLEKKLMEQGHYHLNSIHSSNILSEKMRNEIDRLRNELQKALETCSIMKRKISEYQEEIIKTHEYYKQRDSTFIREVNNDNNVLNLNIDQFDFKENFTNVNNDGKWYKNIISGSIGGLMGALGMKTYYNKNTLSLEDRLKFTNTVLDNINNDNIQMSSYIKTVMIKANFERYVNSLKNNKLIKEIKKYEDENNKLKKELTILKVEYDERENNYLKDIARLNDIFSNQLYESARYVMSLETKLNLFQSSVKDIKILQIIQKDYNGFKSFVKSLNIFSSAKLYEEILTAYRNTYFRTENMHPNTEKIVNYIELVDVLTKNGKLDNLQRVIESDSFNEFMSVVEMSDNILESIILRIPKDNPIAKINDQSTKTEYFLSYLDAFFEESSLSVAIGSGLIAIFMISRNYSNILGLFASMGMYIGRVLMKEIKQEVMVKIYHLIIDALMWSLKMVYKQARHTSSKLFEYIYSIMNGENKSLKDKIELTDPVIEHATLYIENILNGNMPYDEPVVDLPLSFSDFNKSIKEGNDKLDDKVYMFLDKIASGTKKRIELKYRGALKSLAYETLNLIIN